MEKRTKTYREIVRFVALGKNWQQQPPKKDSTPLTGFRYAMSRALKGSAKASEDYNDKQMDINIDAAMTDKEDKFLLGSDGQNVFSKAESKKRNLATRKLLDTEVEVEVYFAKRIPDDLLPLQIDAFEGFVIKEMEEPDESKEPDKASNEAETE